MSQKEFKDYKELLNSFKDKYNLIIAGRLIISIVLLVIALFQIYNVVYNLVDGYKLELFYTALTLRVSAAMIVIYLIFSTKNKFLNLHQAAKRIDKINEDNNDTYQNAIELEQSTSPSDSAFLERIIQRTNKKTQSTKLIYPAVTSKNYLIFIILFMLGNSLLFFTFAGNFRDTWSSFYLQSMPKVAIDYSIDVVPKDTILVSGSDLLIKINNYDNNFSYKIFYKVTDKIKSFRLESDEYLFQDIDQPFQYKVEHEKYQTQYYKVDVFEKLAVNSIKVIYDYPDYTGIESETDTTSYGDISGIHNSSVKMIIETNSSLKTGLMVFTDGSSLLGEKLNDNTLVFKHKLTTNKRYHLNIEDVHGNKYTSPDKSIIVIPDLKPEIEITNYPEDRKIDKNQFIPLTVKVSDDYGLYNLTLHYNVNNTIKLDSLLMRKIDNKIYNYSMILDLSSYNLFPNDQVTLWASVTDHYKKEHYVESEKIVLKLPSLDEIFNELQEQEQKQNEALTQNLNKSKKLQQEFEKKRREVMKKDELDWQDKKELKDIISQQEKMNENIDESAEAIQKMIDEAQKNEVMTQETLAKMEKIKELMQEINSEELNLAMEMMKNKMDKMSSQDMKKALDEMKFSMEEFSKKIEQTLKMLEQLKKEQSLNKLTEMSKELEKMQSELKKQSQSKEGNSPKLSQRQEEIKKQLEEIMKEADKFQDMLNSEEDKKIQDSFNEMKDKADMDSMKQQMQDIADQMQNQKGQQTVSSQQEMISKMQEMTQSLMQMQSMMGSMQAQELSKAKQKAISELIYYAQENKDITTVLDKDPFVVIERIIAEHEMLNLTINKLLATPNALMAISPKFIMDYNDTNTAFRDIFIDVNNNVKYNVSKDLVTIQSGLHNMIFDLMQENGNQQSGGSGMQSFMQQMQQMSDQQMAMNMMTQELLKQLGQGQKKIPSEMRQQLGKLAADEKQLADNLERMLKTNPNAQKQARTIRKLIDELNEVSRNLRYNRLDEKLVKQQENILSRMLEATKSINKRDKSKKRKAEEGDDKYWETPEDIELRFKEIEKNAFLEEAYKDYPKEYQRIILEYIKRLNAENDNE